jgi:tetrahydromethanopterin S-methyltransferase subunit F
LEEEESSEEEELLDEEVDVLLSSSLITENETVEVGWKSNSLRGVAVGREKAHSSSTQKSGI